MKILLFAFLLVNGLSTFAQEKGTQAIDNFEDGEVRLLKYVLPKSVDTAPEKLIFKIFNLPFVGVKSATDNTYDVLLASPLGIDKGDFELEVFDNKIRLAELSVPMNIRTNLRTEEVLDTNLEIVLPSKTSTVERVVREDIELNNLFKNVSPERLWKKGFIRPVNGSISSMFGIYRLYTKHLRRRTHWGVDFREPIGTPVKASGDGRIVFAKSLYFPGKTLVIDHGLGLFTGYSHLSSMKVKIGDAVKKGQIIGKTGNSGKNTGPLLHWFAVNGRVKVNPLSLLDVSLP